MPISSFFGLQTSLRGLHAHQRALDVTGHNIANASTQGYSRQEAVMAAAPALELRPGTASGTGAHLGAGVDIQSYRRVRDTFLDLQFRAQSTRLGEQAGRAEGLDRAEISLVEPSENGINQRLSEFYSAWADFANSPEASETAARQALIEQAESLSDAFATVDAQLATVREQSQLEYDTLLAPGGEVHGIAKQIAELNDTIKRFVSAGEAPNDLLDRRDGLLDKLATLGQVSVEDIGGTGSIKVVFGGAGDPPLVDDATVAFPPAMSAPSGRLGALRELAAVPGGLVESYRSELDSVAARVAADVNAVYTNVGLPPFFAATPGAEAGTLAVVVTPAGLRGSSSTATGANDLALQVAELRGGPGDSAYRAFVTRVGSEVRDARRQESNAEVLASSVEERRQSVAGVSMDEEMTNLMRFQRSYQASARAMSTMDEMLDVLINRTGRVGL